MKEEAASHPEAKGGSKGALYMMALAQFLLGKLRGPEADAFRQDLPKEVRERESLADELLAYLAFQKLQQEALWGAGVIPRIFGARQIRDLRSAIRRCSSELRGLPAVSIAYLALQGADVEEALRCLEAVDRFVSPAEQDSSRRSRWKPDIEDRVALLLLNQGVPLTKYRDGALAQSLRASYAYMNMKAGSDPKRVLSRLCSPDWAPMSFQEADIQIIRLFLRHGDRLRLLEEHRQGPMETLRLAMAQDGLELVKKGAK